MDKFEKCISSALQSDKLDFAANPAIRERVLYRMQLKNSQSVVQKNQILPMLNGLFLAKTVIWKLGVAAIILLSSIGYEHFVSNEGVIKVVDSTQSIGLTDSSTIQFNDTLNFN